MRILVIIPESYSYGGTSRFLERLLDLHDHHGHETALLVAEHHSNKSLESLTARHSVKIFTAVNLVKLNTSPFLTPLLDCLFSWHTVSSWRPDLIVVSTGNPGRMSVVLFYSIPVLYILHTVPEARFRFLPRLYLRIGSYLGNRFMTVSKSAAETISSTMGVPPVKISVVYNSCRLSESKRTQGFPIVLTVGHLVPYKDPNTWLAVAQQVLIKNADVKFVWLGDGELLSTMREMVLNLSLERQVLLPGYVSDPAVWYEKTQVYFQPSLRESHGIAVLEAMSHGLPCVVANTGGLPESVLDNETGFVCPSVDVAGMAERILALLGDSELRERMGGAGRLRIKKYFSEAEQEQKIMTLYDNLVKKTDK